MKQGLLFILSLALLSACSESANEPAQIETDEVAPVSLEDNSSSSRAQQLSGAALYAMACEACHSIDEGAPHRVGPNLNGILGEAAGSRAGYIYSSALQQSGLIWDKASLTAWIVAPESLVPGTWMLYQNVLLEEEVPRLIDFLEHGASSDKP